MATICESAFSQSWFLSDTPSVNNTLRQRYLSAAFSLYPTNINVISDIVWFALFSKRCIPASCNYYSVSDATFIFQSLRVDRDTTEPQRETLWYIYFLLNMQQRSFSCVVFSTRKKKKKVNKVKWMQEVAGQREFIWHCSFNRSRCPSNSLPSSAAYSGCADWMQQLQQSEMEVSSRYLTQQHALSVIDRERGACASL